MLEVKNLTKSFNGDCALADVSFRVEENSYVSLLGASGSGKSVLLRIIAGLLAPDIGSVYLNGESVTNLPCNERNIGFVQQKYALFPHLNVFDNIAFGLRYREIDPILDESEIKRQVYAIIDLVGLTGQEFKMTGQISGGQKQRVSLSRTLVTRPKICLLDEPLGALDANLRERMTLELQNIRSELGISFMHVTGNEFEALAMGQEMLVMEEGRIVRKGKPQELYSSPPDLSTAKSMHSFNIFSDDLKDKLLSQVVLSESFAQKVNQATHCALRMDKISIKKSDNGKDSLSVRYLTNEFLGNKTIYFFKTECGQICEVEDHMSLSKPQKLKLDASYCMKFSPEDILLYDKNSMLIN